jgi:hypothetical protein
VTTATRPAEAPHHNNLTCYVQYRCRLSACVERKRAYDRNITRQQAYGRWQPYVDATPARHHILGLRQAGIGIDRISELTGLSSAIINGILYTLGDKPRRKYLRHETAAKILALTAEHATPDRIAATGTRRRIQALVAAGWPKQVIAAGAGVNVNTVGRIVRQDMVLARTAYAVAALYDRLRVQAPEDHGITPWIANRGRRHAAAQGWHGPLAWDGNIDDPAAQPDTTGQCATHVAPKRDKNRNDEIQHLAGFGISHNEIARRVGLEPKDVTERLKKWAKEDRDQQAVAS